MTLVDYDLDTSITILFVSVVFMFQVPNASLYNIATMRAWPPGVAGRN